MTRPLNGNPEQNNRRHMYIVEDSKASSKTMIAGLTRREWLHISFCMTEACSYWNELFQKAEPYQRDKIKRVLDDKRALSDKVHAIVDQIDREAYEKTKEVRKLYEVDSVTKRY